VRRSGGARLVVDVDSFAGPTRARS